jgi:prepilin-type N-terminal cleavage/methylation domain-containing protein
MLSPAFRTTPTATFLPIGQENLRPQKGFSLVEVAIVTAIVLLLAIIGIPVIGNYLIENKVPKVGEEIARFVIHTQVNASSGSAEPYSAINTASFARMVKDSGLFSVSGTEAATVVAHGLGADGVVQVQAESLGAAFSISLSNVSHVACPSIASIMQRVSTTMSVAGVTIKDASTPYSAVETEAECEHGDVNDFVFTAG